MRTLTTLAATLFLLISLSCSDNDKKTASAQIKNEIDIYLTKAMELHNIPGLALAVVEENEVIYENYLGKASLEDNRLVTKNTLFRIFSATKLITTTGVFQLIQDGKLDLEDPLVKHLDNLPVAWQHIKIKNLLSHSSGLPDIIRHESSLSDEALLQKLFQEEMEFAAGNQFRYNQTNYWLLAQIIEQVTGMPFDAYILENQFQNTKDGVLFSSNSNELIANRATRYFYSGKSQAFEKDTNNSGKRGHSGNGLNITLNQFIAWNNRLNDGTLLDEKAKSLMWSPFRFTNQKDTFLHGWGSYPINHLDSYGFSGGNLAAFRKFTEQEITIILLSNGYEIPAYDIIVNDIARMIIPDLRTKGLTLEEEVMALAINGSFDKAKVAYKTLKDENPNFEFDNLKWNINSIGNSYLYQDKLKKAFEVFKFNAEANPNWWVSVAGLAELYDMQNDTLNAIETYGKAIILNEKNQSNYNPYMEKRINAMKKQPKPDVDVP